MGPASAAAASPPLVLRRNVALDLVAALGIGVTSALVVSLLPSVARRGGLDPIGLAVLASAPFLANVLGAFAGRFGPRSPRQLGILRFGGAALLLLVVILPVPLVLLGVAFGYWAALGFGAPLQHRLWGAMYPARERGRLIGIVATGQMGAAAAAALVGGLLADRIGGLAVVGLAGAIGAACALGGTGLRAPLAAEPPRFSPRASWQAFRSRPVLRRVGIAQLFYGGGLIAATPLYALVMVDRLSLSLGQIGTIGVVTAIAAAVSCIAWGALSDRISGLATIQVGTVLGTLALVGYALAPSLVVLWAAAMVLGLANTATEMGWPSMLGEQTPFEERAAAAAGLNALTGARGLVAPFIAAGLVQAGLVSVSAALLLCAVSTAFGCLLYLAMDRAGQPRPWSQRVRTVGVDGGIRRARALLALGRVSG